MDMQKIYIGDDMESRLKSYLDAHGIKQSWLCEKTGISSTAMSLLVRGKTKPTLENAQRIARTLSTTVDDLWPLEDDEKEDEENG